MTGSLHPIPAPPAFFLECTPHEGEPRLLPAEVDHALKVLRMGAGDTCLGLDGRGHRWPLRVKGVTGGTLALEVEGLPEIEPEPGQEGALLPWIEIAVAWPRKPRAEVMIGALVQLGVAAITPLEARHRGPEPVPARPPERWQKLARTACKQSGRTWLPVFSPALSPQALIEERAEAGSSVAFLDPRSGMSLDTWLRSVSAHPLGNGTRERPIVLIIGPEGGLSGEERTALYDAGTTATRLGPHVLRIETAALSAMAVAATVLCGVYPDERA
jgi:16S rRNA (uracil1498-N3)-methyltransferase